MKKNGISTKGKRTCVGCRQKVKREDVVTFKSRDGELVLDLKGDVPGKGMNVCRNIECFDLAVEKGSFRRVQKVKEISEGMREGFLRFIES